MVAVPLGSRGGVISSNGVGITHSLKPVKEYIAPAINNANYTSSSGTKSAVSLLSKFSKYAAPLASVAVRANPYLSAAMLLYEGYQYFTADDEETGADSIRTSTSQNSDPFAKIDNPSPLDISLSSLQRSPTIKLKKYDPSSFTLENEQSETLIGVMKSSSEATQKALSVLIDSTNAVAVATSNVSRSVNSLGVILAQMASSSSSPTIVNETSPELLAILSGIASILQNQVSSNSTANSDDIVEALNSIGSSLGNQSSPNINIDVSSVAEALDAIKSSLDDGLRDVQTSIEDKPLPDLGMLSEVIANLGTSINPAHREDYYKNSSEVANYNLTPKTVKDMDGNEIATASPLDIKTTSHASTARKHTDENNFELEDEDFDMWDGIPVMDFLGYDSFSKAYNLDS